MQDFYCLPVGQEASLARAVHDAYLFAQYLPVSEDMAVASPAPSYGLGSRASWLAPVAYASSSIGNLAGSVLNAGAVWNAWGHVNACMPWFSAAW